MMAPALGQGRPRERQFEDVVRCSASSHIPKRLNEVFADAVNVWLALGDHDALEIACNAAKTAAGKQHSTMLAYAATADELFEQVESETGSLLSALPSGESFADLTLIRDRLGVLFQQIEEMKDVSLLSARNSMKLENERVVRKADVSFLRTRYPTFPLWA